MTTEIEVRKYTRFVYKNLTFKTSAVFSHSHPVAYLGFQKGGAKFSLATSAHTKGGAKPSFPIFLVCQKKFFLAKGGGHGTMASPLNTPLFSSPIEDPAFQHCPHGRTLHGSVRKSKGTVISCANVILTFYIWNYYVPHVQTPQPNFSKNMAGRIYSADIRLSRIQREFQHIRLRKSLFDWYSAKPN